MSEEVGRSTTTSTSEIGGAPASSALSLLLDDAPRTLPYLWTEVLMRKRSRESSRDQNASIIPSLANHVLVSR
jgi:hypothetical protein